MDTLQGFSVLSQISEHITEPSISGHSYAAINNQEAERTKLQADLNALPQPPASIKAPVISISMYKVAITALIASVKHKKNEELDPWIQFTCQLVQKVIISPSPDGKRIVNGSRQSSHGF